MLVNILAVALGGALGAVGRYLVGVLVGSVGAEAAFWGVFPLSTFIANVVGCFAIGFLSVAFDGPFLGKDQARLFAITGIMGGFTTFSTFSLETVALFQDGAWGIAALNVALSLAACLAGVVLGRMSHRRYSRARNRPAFDAALAIHSVINDCNH